MSKVKKVYAIKYGFDKAKNEEVKNIIVDTWAECSRLVSGVKGAAYKSFEVLLDAEKYLSDDKKLLKKDIDNYPSDNLHIYVDGSYNLYTEKFSYGLVAVKNNIVVYVESNSSEDNSQKQLRQIAGELMASIRAVEYAKSINEKSVVIFHDYEGIYHHAVGTWQRKDESSKNYYEFMNRTMTNKEVEIIFVKVDSHTGDIFNEITDSLAKKCIGVPLTDAVDKYLKNNKITVANVEVESEIRTIIKGSNHCNVINLQNNIEIENIKDKVKENEEYIDLSYINSIYNQKGVDGLEKYLQRLKKAELINIIKSMIK